MMSLLYKQYLNFYIYIFILYVYVYHFYISNIYLYIYIYIIHKPSANKATKQSDQSTNHAIKQPNTSHHVSDMRPKHLGGMPFTAPPRRENSASPDHKGEASRA